MNDVNTVKAADLLAPKDPDKQQAKVVEEKVTEAAKQRALGPDGNPPPNEVVNTIGGEGDGSEPYAGEEKEYNVYHCARDTMHMCTPKGRDIRFVDKRVVTDNKEVIKFLDSEIKAGNRFITVSKENPTVKSSDLNPMATIKKNIIREFLLEQAAEAEANKPRDMGTTPGGNKAVKVAIPSTADLSVAAESNAAK